MLTPEKMCEALPEHGLDVDDGLGVGHVVLLCAHGALLVHHHQVVGVDYTTLEQVVQAGPKTTVNASYPVIKLTYNYIYPRITIILF